MSYDQNKNNGLIPMDIIDEPLLIVLDEDDYDEYENFDSIKTTTNLNSTNEQTKIEVKNLIDSLSIESNGNSKSSPYSTKSSEKSNKPFRTIVIDTSFSQQSRRTKSISKRKAMSTSNSSNNISIDSALSCISFDEVSNILTISRMGSIYYCVEDLYVKIFISLCTLDEFTNLLLKPEIIIVKQVTLSEKISIAQQNPKLKKFNQLRYRLIPIDSSDYLIKLKQLLLINKNNKHIEKIIDEMRSYKQTSTSVLFNDKVSTKRISNDDVEQQKRFQIDAIENGICIECNNNSKNETTSKIPIDKLTEISLVKSDIYPSSFNTNDLSSTEISLHRSKSLIYNKEQIKKTSSRSYSLTSIKFDIDENKMLRHQSKIPKSISSIDDNYSMPMIVNVEENVQVNNQRFKNSEQPPSYAQSLNNTNSTVPPSNSLPYPYLYQSSSLYLTPIRTPYNLYCQESCPSRSSYQKPNEPSSNHYDIQTNNSPSIIMSILEKPIFHNAVKSDQQISTKPCYLPCCSTDQSSLSKDDLSNDRMVYQQYTPSYNRLKSKSPSCANQKQYRIRSNPYTLTKTYFAPLSNRHPSPQNSSMNETTHKTNVHYPKRPVSMQNSLPNNLRLPHNSTQSINLSQAIIEHDHCDIDRIPKLVVRHTKAYSTKTIDTMGQLFPTWFNEPDYRCIHCFSCDQVFTPQLFMTHVDDEKLINEQPLNMSSIQLLTSEKMSEYKVDLWNEFCTNLTIYARQGRIVGFIPNKNF